MIFLDTITPGFFTDVANLSLVILLLPFLSFVVLFFLAHHLPRHGDFIAIGLSALTLVLSLIVFFAVWRVQVVSLEYAWFALPSNKFTVSLQINDLSAIMLLLVSFISLLVHLYSLEYMKGKRNYIRYYPYLGIFTFSMFGIVISDNLLITFMFWELVGFSSYLLIGFWYEKEAAVRAAKKAFLFNRIGDTGFIIAILILYGMHGTLEISYMEEALKASAGMVNSEWMFWIGIGIFMGCVGKSAQFPLQAWLPDAMEGPTPVSALIHAATMVAAGVYLLIKVHFLLTVDVLTIIAFIGAITAFMGALPALFQNDIKKVLAYSTISQLGYMIMAIGVGAYQASLFHLITHGFFKACLFLSAGAVIHAMHEVKHGLFIKGKYRDFDSQDMRWMGAFKSKMPLTFVGYLLSSLALIGLPLFSGFLSKDAILEATGNWASAGSNPVMWAVPLLAYFTVFLTALYMVRQIVLVFFGDFRLEQKFPIAKEVADHIKDPSLLMTGPILILSLLCFWIFFSPNPFNSAYGWFFQTGPLHLSTAILSVMLSLGGIIAGYFMYLRKGIDLPSDRTEEEPKGIMLNNWFLDRIYYYFLVIPGLKTAQVFSLADYKIVDGIIHFFAKLNVVMAHIIAWLDRVLVDGVISFSVALAVRLGAFVRGFQSGKVQSYFIFALMASIILLVWIIIA